jgi:hypothetical protein
MVVTPWQGVCSWVYQEEGGVDHLGRAAGGVDEADGVRADVGRVEGTDEELVVRAVDGVAALERQHVAPLRQRRAYLRRRRAREDALRQLQSLHLAPCVTNDML